MANIDFNKIIWVIAIVSIVLYLIPSFYSEGQFQVSEDIKEQVSPIWKIVLLALGATATYTLIYKYREKGAWTKKDTFILAIIIIALYFLWTQVLSPEKIDILTQSAAHFMNAVS